MRSMNSNSTKKDLRQFGITLGIILGVFGGLHFLKSHPSAWKWFCGTGAVSLLLGVVCPGVLGPAFRVFTKVAHAIGWFNTRVILVLVYYLLVTPTGLIMRLFGKDPLDRKIDRKCQSYWIERKNRAATAQGMEKQF